MPLGYLINYERLALLTDQQVISTAEYQTLLDWRDGVKTMERERELGLKSLEKTREQAHREGYEQGYAEGSEQVSRQLLGIALRAEKIKERLQQDLTNAVVDTISTLLSRIDRRELMDETVRRLGKSLRSSQYVTLTVHPSQLKLAEESIHKVFAELGLSCLMEVNPDPALSLGSCVMESEAGRAEANLNWQVMAIRRAIETSLRQEVDQLWSSGESHD